MSKWVVILSYTILAGEVTDKQRRLGEVDVKFIEEETTVSHARRE